MAPFREWHFTDHCKCSWHCHFAMRQNSFPIQFKLISLYFRLTSLEFNKYNIRNLWMELNLISTLMDTTLMLLRNLPCQYPMWKYCVFFSALGTSAFYLTWWPNGWNAKYWQDQKNLQIFSRIEAWIEILKSNLTMLGSTYLIFIKEQNS